MADGWFAGDHGPIGPWSSEKGSMLAPHTQMPMESSNTGDARFNGTVGPVGWASDVIVTTGMTGGGGTMAK
jgi:hypothetical protein